jgi:hypothetical protein
MKRMFYWDTVMLCYDCKIEGGSTFTTWTDDVKWVTHSYHSAALFEVGDVQVPDTCLILNQIPVDDENFL